MPLRSRTRGTEYCRLTEESNTVQNTYNNSLILDVWGPHMLQDLQEPYLYRWLNAHTDISTVNDQFSWPVDRWLTNNTSHTTDHHSSTHLKSKFVLILIGKTPHFSDNIAQIVLHKHYRWTEFCPHSFLIMIRSFIAVITAKENVTIMFLLQPTDAQINITIFSLYMTFTPTRFDTSVSSGSSRTCALLSYVSSTMKITNKMHYID